MVYGYTCPKCNQTSEIIKPVADYDRVEQCNVCSTVMIRDFAPKKMHLFNTKVQESYMHHGLGQVVRGDNHARQLAKERGWIEIGNENPHKHQKPRLKSYDD